MTLTASLDDLYLGLDDDIEYDSPSSRSPDVLAAIPRSRITMHAHQPLADQSPPAQADHPGFLIDPDLYLRPEDDIIDVDELPDSADPKIDVLAASEASMSYRLGDYKHRTGDLPDPSIPLLLEAKRPFWMAWAETSNKLRRADVDLQRLQRAQWMSIEMLKVVDSLINWFEDQIQM
ncbi:uncharacterized protein BJ212DRAFT_1297158 [Suillus subaureus]|uniref:Uncharacterized protein n=1 Tax=Suillus subaureus TaxID=48587 RepID=A0A9P7JH11_9AGAM|nr:uncharacterized protein BJ212DRAFT_1297158 [Suillus subaureus]KAG1821860.1 hypothetical protein BJ212DRAFT_1297158 [Suillus subaureus]